jgi:hypothetical protein
MNKCHVFEIYLLQAMKEPGEQCNVVFALIVTEQVSECACVGRCFTPHPPGYVTNYVKTTVHCSPDMHK